MNHMEEGHRCYFHPREVVVGICALCLNERLLVLAASRQEQLHHHHNSNTLRTHSFAYRRKPINLPKIFALSSLLNRLDHLRHRKPDDDDDDQYYMSDKSAGSQEDSFISIRFGDNGAASWEKSMAPPKVSLEHCNMSLKQRLNKEVDDDHQGGVVKAVIEHPKSHGPLRWRKRIGYMLQLIRWKKPSRSGNACCHVGKKLDGVNMVRHGWISTLTKTKNSKE